MTETTHHPWPVAARRLQVGDVRVDLRYRRVLRDGEEVELPHRIFDLLLVFLAAPHGLHTRADLFRKVWPGVVVEDANLSQSVWLLRRTLGQARKDWIRTVARSGYVFEPPTSVEVLEEPAMPAPMPDATGELPSPASAPLLDTAPAAVLPEPGAPRAPARRRAWLAAAAGLLGFAIVAGTGLRLGGARPPAVTPSPPVAISLIELHDAGAAGDGWTTTLLNAWLSWKLSLLPEVTLLSEAQLAAGADSLSPVLVLLASGQAQDDPDQIYVRARLPGPGGEQQIELRGEADDAPALVDALSREVIGRILSARGDTSWPALALDLTAARQYTLAFEASRRHDWSASIAASKRALQRAPKFGPAHLQLAGAQGRLGQMRDAQQHMALARKLLEPMPDDSTGLLDAMQLAMAPDRREAAARAFGTLADAYPQRTSFRLAQASQLNSAGQSQQALALLTAPAWDRQPAGTRIERLLAMADAQLALNDPERATASARKADELAAAVGEGWAMERGEALLVQARADLARREQQADLGLFDRAAEQFELAGSPVNALLARYEANSIRAPVEAAAQLDVLLARVREAGYRNFEVNLLQHAALHRYMAGDHAGYRQRLEQALAVAQDTGDPKLQETLKFHLLGEDLLRGDFAGAELRLSQMRPGQLEEDVRFILPQFEALLASLRGDYRSALAALARSEEQIKVAPGSDPATLAQLACDRAALLLQQGQLARAQTDFDRCDARGHTAMRLAVLMNQAHVALLTGDHARGLALLDQAQARIETRPPGPDRWEDEMNLAYLRTRAGQVDGQQQVYARILPRVADAGYGLVAATAHTGLAEVASVRSDWDASRRHAAAARALLPADEWSLRSRLLLLDGAAALARGERESAQSQLIGLEQRAHELGDALVELEVHSLMDAHDLPGAAAPAERNALVARTGLRGVDASWLQLPPTTRTAMEPLAQEP